MADAQTPRLCAQIVHSHFGPLNRQSRVGTAHPRSLDPRANRALYADQAADGAGLYHRWCNIMYSGTRTLRRRGEVFEMNIEECLLRLRFGRFVWQTGELFGNPAAEIVQLILDHGKLRSPEIISHLALGDAKATRVYTQAMHSLVTAAYLKPSTILSHVSPRDKRIRYEAEEKAKISGFPTAKELREAKETAEARLKREEAEAEKVGLVSESCCVCFAIHGVNNAVSGLQKRKAVEQTGPRTSKRKAVEEEEVVDPTVYFRVNCDRFNVHIRNAVRAACSNDLRV
ncbi:RNA polymerase III subunit C3 [Mycena chlorophos]|uniref:DNA-directed RNA polymerase III subunit RPC3 n=1 Tax=Mycena chlorophos TaxID=658473 RepID=A0A8H6T8N8_MYCCL|nr:RNA polymerase III subunit C3 [Mycena chlorophos]